MSKRTTEPITTGTSILGLVYKDGVLLACDTLASYGSLAYWQNVSRIAEVADGTALAASGEFSDFQEAQEIIGELARRDRCLADHHPHDAREIWNYMARIMYAKRNKMNPLYNSFLIAGMIADSPGLCFFFDPLFPFFLTTHSHTCVVACSDSDKKRPFLGQLDLFGTAFETKISATGYGLHLALPLMRSEWREDMTCEEGKALLEKCLKVLVFRDARASDRVQMANITADGVEIGEPYHLNTTGEWNSGESAIRDPKY